MAIFVDGILVSDTLHNMTSQQFKQAFQIADNFDIDLTGVDNNNHFGFGLSTFKPIYTTIAAVAKTIRYQGLCFNGNWDMEAVNEIARFGKTKFIIID